MLGVECLSGPIGHALVAPDGRNFSGDHLEHTFGRGKRNLAMTFAGLNMLALAAHTVCDCLGQIWADARA